MNSTFFANFFTQIETASKGLETGMNNLVTTVMPLFASLFVVYIIMVAINYWNGSFEGFLTDAIKRFLGIAALLALGVNISNYNSTVFPIVSNLGESLGNAWTSSGTGGGQPVPVMLDNIINRVSEISNKNLEVAWQGAEPDANQAENNPAAGIPATSTNPTSPTANTTDEGWYDKISGAFSDASQALAGSFDLGLSRFSNVIIAVLQDMMIWAFALLFVAIAAGFLLIAQILLLLLAAVAPIFFAFGIFPATRTYFTNWCGQVLTNGFLFLFVNVLSTMFLNFCDDYLKTFLDQLFATVGAVGVGAVVVGGGSSTAASSQAVVDAASAMLDFAQIGSLCAMFLVFAVVLLKLPDLSASLFGGLAASGYSNTVKTMAGAVKGIPNKSFGKKKSGGSASNNG